MSLKYKDGCRRSDGAASQWAIVLERILDPESVAKFTSRMSKSIVNGVLRTRLNLVGFSSVQNDKYLEVWEETLLVPVGQPDRPDEPACAAEKLRKWRQECPKIVKKMATQERGKSSLRHPELTSTLSSVRTHAEAQVAPCMAEILISPEKAWERANAEYRTVLAMVATAISPGFTSKALARKLLIEKALPLLDKTPKEKPTKTKPKKRGGLK